MAAKAMTRLPRVLSHDTLCTLGGSIEEQREIERLLSERLVQGFCLLEKSCPSCTTPLVKQNNESSTSNDEIPPAMSMSDETMAPIVGVPFCVKCQAHVVSEAAEVERLEQQDIITSKKKGSIMVVAAASTEENDYASRKSSSGLIVQEYEEASSMAATGTSKQSGQREEVEIQLENTGSYNTTTASSRVTDIKNGVMGLNSSNNTSLLQRSSATNTSPPKLREIQPQQQQQPELWQIQQQQVQKVLAAQQRKQENKTVGGEATPEVSTEGRPLLAPKVAQQQQQQAMRKPIEHIQVKPHPESFSNNSNNCAVDIEEIEVINFNEEISTLANQTSDGASHTDQRAALLQEQATGHPSAVAEESTLGTPEIPIVQAKSHEETVELAIQRSESILSVTGKPVAKVAIDFPMPEYKVRREVATKVLASKMVQGYMIKEEQCGHCFMPLMNRSDQHQAQCFVCPVLRRKYLKEQKMLGNQKTPEKGIVEQQNSTSSSHMDKVANSSHYWAATTSEVIKAPAPVVCVAGKDVSSQSQSHSSQPPNNNSFEASTISTKRGVVKDLVAKYNLGSQLFTVDKSLPISTPPQKGRAAGSDSSWLKPPSAKRCQDLDAQADRLQADVKNAESSACTVSLPKIVGPSPREAELARLISEKNRHVQQETRRLSELEKRRVAGLNSSAKGMLGDLNTQQQRAILNEKAQLKKEIDGAIQARTQAELEARRLADEKRALEEASVLTKLEEEASAKQKEAEEAMGNARKALEHIQLARQKIYAKTIAEGQAEAIAEAESIVRAEAEDYQETTVIPSADDIIQERWAILRSEARSVMTRRIMAGWELLPHLCEGAECENSPLLSDGSVVQCVVCGGDGSGKDGAYAASAGEKKSEQQAAHEYVPQTGYQVPAVVAGDATLALPKKIGTADLRMSAASPTQTMTLQELQNDFDTKRDMVSKEIGKRMAKGWTLLDMTCPRCVMPLMTDPGRKSEICVLCGLVGRLSEGMTQHSHIVPDSDPAQSKQTISSVESKSTSRKSSLTKKKTVKASVVGVVNKDRAASSKTSKSRLKSPSKRSAAVTKDHAFKPITKSASATTKSSSKTSLPSKTSTNLSKKLPHVKSKTVATNSAVTSAKSPLKNNSTAKKSLRKPSAKKESMAKPYALATSSKAATKPLSLIDSLRVQSSLKASARSDPPEASGDRRALSRSRASRPERSRLRRNLSPGGNRPTLIRSLSPVRIKSSECAPEMRNDPLSDSCSSVRHSAATPLEQSLSRFKESARKRDAPDTGDYETGSVSSTSYIERDGIIVINDDEGVRSNKRRGDTLTLEIPKEFDRHDDRAIRRMIDAATTDSPLEVDTTMREGGRRNPSPGLEASAVPSSLLSPCSYDTSSAGSRSIRSQSVQTSVSGRAKRVPSPGLSTAQIPMSHSSVSSYHTGSSSKSSGYRSAPYRPRISPEMATRSRGSFSSGKPSLPSYLPGYPRRINKSVRGTGSSDPFDPTAQNLDTQSRSSQRPSSRTTHTHTTQSLGSQSRSSHSRSAYAATVAHHENNRVINVESLRIPEPKTRSRESHLWQNPPHISKDDGRDDAVVGDGLLNTKTQSDDSREGVSVDTDTLDALLARIEKTKSQLEEATDTPAGPKSQYRLRGLIENLSKAAEQMQKIDQS